MLGQASTSLVTSALNASRSTASAPPAATRATSAALRSWLPIRRISSLSRPEAESSRSALRLLGADELGKSLALVGRGKVGWFLLIELHLHALARQPERRLAARKAGTQYSNFVILHFISLSSYFKTPGSQ